MTLTPDQQRLHDLTAAWREAAQRELDLRIDRDEYIRAYAQPPHNLTVRQIAEAIGTTPTGRMLIGHSRVHQITQRNTTQP